MAAETENEQIMDLRLTLSYLGVPIKGATYLFGYNKTVVASSAFLIQDYLIVIKCYPTILSEKL